MTAILAGPVPRLTTIKEEPMCADELAVIATISLTGLHWAIVVCVSLLLGLVVSFMSLPGVLRYQRYRRGGED